MKQIATLILFLCSLSWAMPSMAQEASLDNESRGKYLAAIRDAKHEFLTRELQLTPEQQEAFFPVYDQMEDEVNKVSTDARALENKALANEMAADAELEATARILFEQKSREGQIESMYFEKFKETLTPRQLIRLKNAERKFTKQLVKHHGRTNSAKRKP